MYGYQPKDQKIISVNWNDAKSIDKGEKAQQRLINNGYKLTKTINGFINSTFIYKL